MRVVVVGAGFAGAILARLAQAQGHAVTLVERGRHPRFALGESSTPLAAIVLERLAARYGLEDLQALAAWGRWGEVLPGLGRGLKRGFTFYGHVPGLPFGAGEAGTARLLVAASADDAVADTHWKRADVDAHLVARAAAEGVTYMDHTAVASVEARGDGVRLQLEREGRSQQIDADLVVDASGGAGAIATRLGAVDMTPPGLRTSLVYGHFTNVAPLRSVLPDGVNLPEGPFPDERAAVHHLLAEGWLYELRFDDEVVSAGFVVEDGPGTPSRMREAPADAFRALLARYPTLAAQFEGAQPVRPIAAVPQLQRQRGPVAGEAWAALPHTVTFWSPLYSTGIAWSLLAVERLGLLLERGAGNLAEGLTHYADLVEHEVDHVRMLVEPAYWARQRFDLFDAVSQAYFAAASFEEARQRLSDPPDGGWAWQGFLGATDPVTHAMVSGIGRLALDGGGTDPLGEAARLIAPRNVAGLADASKARRYGVDLDALVAAAPLLGLTPAEVRTRLPRLRGLAH